MKKFLLNTVSMAAILLGAFALLHIAHAVRESNRFILPKGKRIVALSNSHTQCALSDENWPEFINLSSSGSTTWIWLWKLQTILSKNPSNTVQCVIIPFGVAEATHQGSEAEDVDWFVRYFPMGLVGSGYPRSIHKAFLSNQFLDSAFSMQGITTKWSDPPPPDGAGVFDAGPAIERHFGLAQSSGAALRTTYFANVTNLIQIALNSNIDVVLLATPCHPEYRNNVPATAMEMRNRSVDWIRDRFPNVKFLDFYEMDWLERQDYRDPNHLSSSGRTKLTNLVKAELMKQ